MPSKSKTKTSSTQQAQSTNSLPSWLTSPYQQAVTQAGKIAAQPAISTGTQASIDATRGAANFGNAVGGYNALNLTNLASGNFGNNALTGAANGSFLSSNPWIANGNPTTASGALSSLARNGLPTRVSSALNGYTADGKPIQVSGALSGFASNGGLDTGYIKKSGLNQTASGYFLNPDTNPFIKGVADRGADAAQARINAQFGAAGRSGGSGLYAQLFGEGIADAANQIYYQNYDTERGRQVSAQGTLLSAEQAAREAALARQYGAAGSIFGAENQSRSDAAGRAFNASGAIFNAGNAAQEAARSRQASALSQQYAGENALREAAAGRASSAYEAERARQQAAAGGLLSTQLSASGQLPGLLSQIMSGNAGALAAGSYGDQAAINQMAKYSAILSGLGNPFGITNSTGSGTSKTTQKGSIVNTLLQIGSNAAQAFAAGG